MNQELPGKDFVAEYVVIQDKLDAEIEKNKLLTECNKEMSLRNRKLEKLVEEYEAEIANFASMKRLFADYVSSSIGLL